MSSAERLRKNRPTEGDARVIRKVGSIGYDVEVWIQGDWRHIEWCLTLRGAKRVARRASDRATGKRKDRVVWRLPVGSGDDR